MLESDAPGRTLATDAAMMPAAVHETSGPGEVYKKRTPIGVWIAVGWLTIVVLAAILAPVLPLKNPLGDLQGLRQAKQGWFTAGHPFGVDDGGRDVLSRMVWGARASLLIAVGSIGFGVLVGGFFGLVSGFLRGPTDTVLSSLFNIVLAFPQLVLALTLVSVLSPSPAEWSSRIRTMVIAVGIVSVPILARITRANTLVWSQREFVLAARAQGAKPLRVMFREVLPNVLPAMLSIAILGVAIVIVLEGGLALFGLSVPLPEPSWGNMIAQQIDTIDSAPHSWQAPAMGIFLTVLALNYIGDYIRSRFDVRESAI